MPRLWRSWSSIAPWIWRCSKVYGRFVAFRGGFGLEVLVGNSADTSTVENGRLLPGENPVELEKVRKLGEPAYMARSAAGGLADHCAPAVSFSGSYAPKNPEHLDMRLGLSSASGIRRDGPAERALLHLVSLLAFAGLWRAIRDRREDVLALVIPVIVFPVVSYVTHSEMRYRHPIDPVLVVFIAYGIVAFRGRKLKSAAG